MTTPQPRRRGRPSLVEGKTSTIIAMRVSPAQYDRLDVVARRDRVSASDVLRRALSKLLREEDRGR